MSAALERLRERAVAQTFFAPTTLPAAIRRLGFVQADPIRAPARAQDLILRHRVKGYVAGDLERRYPSLDVEEDYVHAYGFLPRAGVRALHPRGVRPLSALEERVLTALRRHGRLHPAELEAAFGRERVVNDWGGSSKATTRALDWLHYAGYARIARRDGGIRVYAPVRHAEPLPARERLSEVVRLLVGLLAPVPAATVSGLAARFRRHLDRTDHREVVRALLASGELVGERVDGTTYLRPAKPAVLKREREVRFLAPFDPLVWDRRRFEHLWGWAYRFEAYTPVAKRVRGYYALPLVWGTSVIGWANARAPDGKLAVELGFVAKRPREVAFRQALEAEVERLRVFLGA
jgi:hypothetical protein